MATLFVIDLLTLGLDVVCIATVPEAEVEVMFACAS